MEKFRYAIEDLILHCETYNKYKSGYEWYKNFEKLYRILENSWSEIWFVFDIKRDRLFLKDIVDFYGDFKRLTKERFELLSSDIADTTKNEFKMQIENIVIETNVGNVANINFRKDINRLTKYYQEILLGVDDIYLKKHCLKRHKFNKYIITKTNFNILEPKYEKYIEILSKKMKKMDWGKYLLE